MKVIKVDDLSKKYSLGTIGTATLKSVLFNNFKKQPKKKIGEVSSSKDYWALKNISFDLNQGESLAIIGKNGAGKSTLLKILSRITSPTNGEAKIRGRLTSLLEVGTGFHPELSGKDNIYLNGAILGMKKIEIQNKLDEIIEFSGIEKFIDTPVKRYSSGMYVRLAFAVAAHLESEILIIDEVLAVGDSEFQKKCMGKMNDVVKNHGRTIVFVSHNMLAASSICTKGIILKTGEKIFEGEIGRAISLYQDIQLGNTNIELEKRTDRQGTGKIRFSKIWTEDENGNSKTIFRSGDTICIAAQYSSDDNAPISSLQVSFALTNPLGDQISDLWSQSTEDIWENVPSHGIIICQLNKIPLNAGIYRFNVCGRVNNIIADWVVDIGNFEIEAGDFFKTGRLPEQNQGYFLFNQKWYIK